MIMIMKVLVKTKGNYKNCNGKWLDVIEFLGDTVGCKVPEFGFSESGVAQGKFITSDFSIKNEVQEIKGVV